MGENHGKTPDSVIPYMKFWWLFWGHRVILSYFLHLLEDLELLFFGIQLINIYNIWPVLGEENIVPGYPWSLQVQQIIIHPTNISPENTWKSVPLRRMNLPIFHLTRSTLSTWILGMVYCNQINFGLNLWTPDIIRRVFSDNPTAPLYNQIHSCNSSMFCFFHLVI